MKNKGLIITTIAFFLIVNTAYFWEGKLGLFAILAFLILVLVYFGLAIAFVRKLYFAVKEKSVDRIGIITLGLMTTVLCLTFIFPFGIIDFDKLSGEDLLIAQREGVANCMTTFKLKDNHTFREKRVCFGVTEIKGNYKIVHDTIYFENVEFGGHEDTFYKFAVIRPSKFNEDNKQFDLVRFKDFKDTTGHVLWIVKNDLNKPADKSRTAGIRFVK
ncbi:hypothetical protein [Chitinophaga sp. GbtcB8]|uniref:hypothetical protein n=1 Tax=Chitinophaga sp. GbtcB8 TaxID=2824753 RepID=UPI001C302215|nr:hypothetical protein [Chitinophaga sp. GbtcB8]